MSNIQTQNDRLFSAILAGDIKTVNACIQDGVDVNATNSHGYTPLHIAAARDEGHIVDALIKAGANPNAALEQFTPLHNAAAHCKLEGEFIVKALIKAGANPNAIDANGNTPLDLALKEGKSFYMIQELIELGAKVNTHSLNILEEHKLKIAQKEAAIESLLKDAMEKQAAKEAEEIHKASIADQNSEEGLGDAGVQPLDYEEVNQ